MRKIILDLAVTLDGFIEGPNAEIDWCIMDEEMKFNQFLSSIDTIFYGRISYDSWGNYQPAENASNEEELLWKNIHAKKKYVFSTKKRTDSNATFIDSDILQKVRDIKNQTGSNIWLYGGAKLIKTFIQMHLIDVYRISVHPVALGGGTPLFEGLTDRLNLKLLETKTFQSGVVQLIYEHV